MDISVVIPAYNEEKNITATLADVVSYLQRKFDSSWEVLIVDDGSLDETYRMAGSYIAAAGNASGNIKLLKNDKNTGKGSAVRKGMIAAKGEIRLFMDADNATRISEVEKFLPLFRQGADIVIGSRKIRGSLIVEKQPLIRRLGSLAYHLIVKFVLGTNASDYNCGFKALKGSVAEKIFSVALADGWEFDAEILFIAKKKGYSIKEAPVIWEHKDTSKVRAASAGISSLKGVLKIKRNDIAGKYNN